MKKVIILRKIHVTMKSFASDNERYEKETRHIHASAANLLHARKGNPDWSVREASHRHPAFMGICLTIIHTC